MGNCICILSKDKDQMDELSSIVREREFELRAFQNLNDLLKGLNHTDCLAVIMDVDSVPATNRMIRQIKTQYSEISIFFTSEHRLHPDLKDSLSTHICACLKKPLDPDELDFWLKCIRDNELISRAPL